jgi:hypothetical protein
MSRNGSGTYTLPAGNPVVSGTTITTAWANTTLNDIAATLTGSIAADGQTVITGPLAGTGGTVQFGGTGQVALPTGDTAQRSATPSNGMIRYNTAFSQFEGYSAGSWTQVGGGATGGGGDQVFVENSRVVTTNYTIPVGKSAESVGPITVNSGITVTVSPSERWVIL